MVYLICYDITNIETFYRVPHWHQLITNIMNDASAKAGYQLPYTIILVGNKGDLSPFHEQRYTLNHVEVERLTNGCQQLGVPFGMETSSKTGENVGDLFDMISKLAFNNLIRVNLTDMGCANINEKDTAKQYHERHGYYPIDLQV